MLHTPISKYSGRLAAAALALASCLRLASPAAAALDATDHSDAPAHIAEALGLPTPAAGGWWDSTDNVTADEIATSAPANILTPGQKMTATFQVKNSQGTDLNASGFLEVRRYDLTTVDNNIFKYEMHGLGVVAKVPLSVSIAAGKAGDISCTVPVPARFGGYALIMDLGPTGGRHLVGLCIRTFKMASRSEEYPVLTLDDRDHTFLEKIGIHAIRTGVVYKPTTQPDFPQYLAGMKKSMDDMKVHHITCTVLFQGNENEYLPFGMWAHKLNDQNQMLTGSPVDTMWMPSYDPDFSKFVQIFCETYGWPKGPVTATYLYNEPWEGGGISGWLSDMPRYREGYKAMADGVLAARRHGHAQVLVGGTDSSTNAQDKLFGDGKDTFLPIFDFVSMHYQSLDSNATNRLWRDRKGPLGRVRFWDTESWEANTDDNIAAQVASWRAAGYDRIMGVDANATCDARPVSILNPDGSPASGADGSPAQTALTQPSSVAAAEAAAGQFLGSRPFRRILFKKGLPWVFVFDGLPGTSGQPNPEDGTVVVAGDVLSGDRSLFRTVEALAQQSHRAQLRRELAALPAAQREAVQLEIDRHVPITGARMVLAAGPRYGLYDYYGNLQPAAGGRIIIPLNTHGYFLRGSGKPGSFAALILALQHGRIEGLEPVEIIAHDMTAPVEQHPALRLSITNVLNRPVQGRLTAHLAGLTLAGASQMVTIGPNQTKEIRLTVTGGHPAVGNTYLLNAVLNAGADGNVTHTEPMHCNVIARRTITVDGDLSEWSGILPQTVTAGNTAPSLTEQAWYPGKSFSAGASGSFAVAYMAYDDRCFYFAAKVAGSSPDPGTLRFATRDDDSFFYPDTVYVPASGKGFQPAVWPKGVRHYIYRKDPILPAGNGSGSTDNIQIGFNVVPEEDARDKGMYPFPPGTMPHYIGFKDTDYEYALNQVAPQYGGGTEIWRLLTPGMPYKTFYPRQGASPFDGPVSGGKLVITQDGTTRITEASIPWSELPWVKRRLDAGQTVKFSFRVNDSSGTGYELAHDRSVSQQNSYAFHNPWVGNHWANEIEFGFEKPSLK